MNFRWLTVIFAGCSIMFLSSSISAEETKITENDYKIFSSKSNDIEKIANIVDAFKDYDIVVFGEEHNDAVGHYLERLIFEKLYDRYGKNLTLSMEMFDRDVQVVLNEYLAGKIKEYYLKKDARAWINYKDYRPLVEFAKENQIDMIAANAPFRYVDMANKLGQNALLSLSQTAKSFLAPLPYDSATGAYLEKLKDLIAEMKKPKPDTAKTDSVEIKKMPMKMPHININQGQSLWNATMAYFVLQYLEKNPGKKIMHINGRMHSDEYFGVVEQLRKYDEEIKVMVISALPDSSFANPDFKKFKNFGDFVIITNPTIPKTFEE